MSNCILLTNGATIFCRMNNYRDPTQNPPRNFRSVTAGQAIGQWNQNQGIFQFRLPPGTYKADTTFVGTSGIYNFYFDTNANEGSHVSW